MTATEVPISADPDLAMMGEVLPNAPGPLARFHLSRHLLTIFVVVVALLWLLPSISMLIISFRPESLFEQSGWWHLITNPAEFTISNYKNLFAGPRGGPCLQVLLREVRSTRSGLPSRSRSRRRSS